MCVTNRLSEPTLGHYSDAVPAMKEEASALIAVLARAWPCWAVSGRLVGIAAATLRASPRTLTAPVAKATSVSALLSTGSLLLSAA